MRIAVIGNSAETMLNFRSSLIVDLIKHGHEVLAFAPDHNQNSRNSISALGAVSCDYYLQRSGINPASDIRTILSLWKAFSKNRPDAVLCYFVKPVIYGALAASLSRVERRVLMLEGLGYSFAERGKSLHHRIVVAAVRMLLRVALSGATRTLVLNEDDRVTLTQQIGISAQQVANIGGIGVELGKFEASPVRENATTFAMAARLIIEKGVLDYVEAARRIREMGVYARFLLLGGVDDNPSALTAREVQSWHDEGIIEWPGKVGDIQTWLKTADVFVLPSYYREGVPRSIQEAMALGRPIITTDHVGCRDTVVQGRNGVLVAVRDVDALVLAMLSFLTQPGLAVKMGRESRRLAEERFDSSRADTLIRQHIEGEI